MNEPAISYLGEQCDANISQVSRYWTITIWHFSVQLRGRKTSDNQKNNNHRTPLTTKQLHDNQLLYFAAIINYATSNITDGRWQEVKHPSNGWQIEPHLVSGTTRYFVWPDKQATADQKMVMPNWFSVSDNVVTLHSFIIHSGGQDVVHEISVQEIIHWHNQSQVRLQRLEKIQANSRLLTEMTKKTSSTNR